MVNTAYARGQLGCAGGLDAAGGGFGSFVPFILMFVIFYFLLIRPKKKKAKENQEMIKSLKKGDKVITSGGIHGQITSLDDTTVTIEIAENVRIKVTRSTLAGLNK